MSMFMTSHWPLKIVVIRWTHSTCAGSDVGLMHRWKLLVRGCSLAVVQPKRKGRGIGSGLGKTAGRGHKGQKARRGLSLHLTCCTFIPPRGGGGGGDAHDALFWPHSNMCCCHGHQKQPLRVMMKFEEAVAGHSAVACCCTLSGRVESIHPRPGSANTGVGRFKRRDLQGQGNSYRITADWLVLDLHW